MNEVTIDVNEGWLAGDFAHHVRVPNFFVEGQRGHQIVVSGFICVWIVTAPALGRQSLRVLAGRANGAVREIRVKTRWATSGNLYRFEMTAVVCFV